MDASCAWHWRCRQAGCAARASHAIILVIPKYAGASEAHTLLNVRLCAAHADLKAVASDIKESGFIDRVSGLIVATGRAAPEFSRARWRKVELKA